MPEHNPLYAEMYVREYLQFQASLYKVGHLREVDHSIQKVGLESQAHKKIHQLSKGFQQRVGLAAAILHNPKVLILDEPTTGLDPNQLVEIRALIQSLGKEKTVLFSTHIMQEVEAVCDRVIILQKGVILMDKTLLELQQIQEQVIEVTFDVPIEKAQFDSLKNKISIENTHGNTWKIRFDLESDMRSKVFDFAHENNFKILELNSQHKTLETLFREVTNS